jgi:hypothetical protein
MFSVQLECVACGWRTVCGEAEIVRRLRAIGLFRRAAAPPGDLVVEMLRSHGHRLACDCCQATGLARRLDGDDAGRDEWEQVVVCEVCRQPIPEERLAVFPRATRCAACQDAADRGKTSIQPEYCPKCGAVLELRVSRSGGVTRYKLFCTGHPPCRL